MTCKPLIVGIGGTTRNGSTSERLLHQSLAVAAEFGGETLAFTGDRLVFPIYGTGRPGSQELEFIDALRRCDGVIIASPGYHGSVSGMIKNALDYAEELRGDARPYLEGRPVGLIAAAAGWQAAGSTLGHLRAMVHALRGWPTPLGIIANSSLANSDCGDQIAVMTRQMMDLAGRLASGRGEGDCNSPVVARVA